MALADVESILGDPAHTNMLHTPKAGWVRKKWLGSHDAALVFFDQTGKVRSVLFVPLRSRNESVFDKARRWLRL
jgi:hypothetical protein